MTIIEAITKLDELKFNTYSKTDKIEWLSRLDSAVKLQIIDTHEGRESVTFTGYDQETDMDTKLLAPAPYDELYLRWMEAQIDYHNGEYEKYNNSITMYNAAYTAFRNDYNRTHMPICKHMKFF